MKQLAMKSVFPKPTGLIMLYQVSVQRFLLSLEIPKGSLWLTELTPIYSLI